MNSATMQTAKTPRQNIADIYPLSPMQQGILFHTLLSPAAGVYVPQVTFTLMGELDRDRLKHSWEQALSDCSVLRTSFHWEKRDQPFQVVRKEASLPWVEQDWRALSESELSKKLELFLDCDRTQPFDLKSPPLIRLSLLQLTDTAYQFIFSYHHLILDGWSVGQLLQRVFSHYFQVPSSAPLTPYSQFISWLNQQNQETDQDYWKSYLQGFCEPTALPLDRRTGHQVATPRFCQKQLQWPAEATQVLKGFAQQNRVTLNTLIQGAFALLLSHYDDMRETPEVLFGVTSAGRPPELQNSSSMIGLFINTSPLRVKLPSSHRLRPWLQYIQAEQSRASEHEHTSLIDLQSLCNLPVGTALFNSLLVFENYPVTGLPTDSSSLSFDNLQFNEWNSFPLSMLVTTGESMSFSLKYDGDRISNISEEHLLHHLTRLLVEMMASPDACLGDFHPVSKEELETLNSWNQTQQNYPVRCLSEAFESQVKKTPDAIALRFESASLTYKELNEQANQLAHHLQSLGVVPEARVAVYLERSVELVVSLLAIIKAGGTYVPLDPDYPSDRLQYILEDVQPALLIQDSRQVIQSPPEFGSRSANAGGNATPQVLDLADSQDTLQNQTRSNPNSDLKADHSLYILYTSGSTGRPKGVVNTHRALMNRLDWMQDAYGLGSSDRILQKTPFSFDVSVWEFFWPLLNGAQLVLAAPDGQKDSQYLAQLIADAQITTLHFVPSMLQAFLDVPDLGEKCQLLRRVICSGEALSIELQNQFFSALDAELHNLYGPTEAAIDVTSWQCQRDDTASHSVPIGRPISNIQIHLLDENGQPVPIGAAGELCIGGVGLARGYWNRPDLTAEKFIPNPFASGYIYRSGDRARYRSDGTLEYLGRLDQQVKLRGFRIELEEIAAVLQTHPAVNQCVVVLSQKPTEQLVAYWVPNQTAPESPFEEWLAKQLPDFMVPRTFIRLEGLPLTPNGKLNRRALPEPTTERNKAATPPRNATETAIAQIWQDVLKLDSLCIEDNFFELGGHSLSATRVTSRLQTQFELEIPLKLLFEQPTIAGLATHIDALQLAQNPASKPLNQTNRKEITI
ncbi:MAG: amino acid adenylation domain-containing protein [Cyanobacteria bacterium P01_F01_bin.42]